jgi:hypothetical protein
MIRKHELSNIKCLIHIYQVFSTDEKEVQCAQDS